MRLSAGVEWGLHCAVLLAALPRAGTLPGRALAEFHGISESYLLKHLKALTKAGVFESIPGPTGGYRLARAPDQITVLEMVEAIEGPEPSFRCTDIRQRGPAAIDPELYRVRCGIHASMLRADLAWKQALRSQTLADLVAVTGASIDRQRVELARAWLKQNVRHRPARPAAEIGRDRG
jgi:Rrf2 family protein